MMHRVSKAALLYLLAASRNIAGVVAEEESKEGGAGVTKAQGPPPFFLQDASDSMCLGGEEFKRCSIDTLFFVVGSPGNYQIHKRPIDEADDDEDGLCIAKKSCNEKDIDKIQEVKIAKCTHCGAKNWNILGDAETGYVLTEGDGKTCLVREPGTIRAMTAPCDSETAPYTPLQLQFATSSDIKAMASPAARLIGAASDGDKKTITALLKDEKVDVNVRDWDDLTALIPAASSGHMDIVKLLLKEGCDVNAKDKDGITALMEAAIMGHSKIVDVLLEAGAEVDAKANSDVTALWLASGEGRTDVMKTLLKSGADASNTRTDGITALMTASVGGHADAVEVLLENGADPRATDSDGLNPLMNAAENGTVAVLKLLVDGAGDGGDVKYVDTISTTGFTPLIIASAHGHTDAVGYLITEANANVNQIHPENGVTPLMYAAASGHVDVMKVLLEDGKVDIDQLHSNKGSALLEAATGGASEAISFLIEKGAKFDLIDDDGVTPLMAVASQGHLDGVNSILAALKNAMSEDQVKEHINLASFSGGTSVMFAAAGGHPKCTQALIENGADVNAIAQATPDYLEKLAKMIEEGTVEETDPHVDGVTAVHVAAQGGHLECVKHLVAAGADVTILDDEERSPLLLSVKGNFGEVATELVRAGADPNTVYVDEDGESHNLLMDAIIVENDEFAILLIGNGADPYHEDENKVTTLLQASHRGMADVVKALLKRHKDAGGKEGYVDSPSDEGITPLIAAASEGHVEVVKLLIDEAKADVDAKDKDETNSLMAASARGHNDVVELLLAAGAKVNEQNVDGHTALMFAYNGKNQVETLWERYNQFVNEAKAEQTDKGESEEEIDDGGTGPIIREALDNHTALVELLLKNGADEKLKDKEGHTAADFDFHPDADADVLGREEKAAKKRDESKNEL
uniref:Uncharacterized protein n=2 Tax=Ditylum brightwellii TaxID=49249 RepID=A0A6U3Q8H2_9STRA|mmetsp:Transcript_35434/g.47564  ORF Transcript_35434/g.47564 Transcript_35434/m.47564 type:complete len:920 (+) Transcript_35434:107-2866(+)